MAAFASDCALAATSGRKRYLRRTQVHVGDADEAEGGQVWGDGVGRSIFMDTAAAGNDDRAFTGYQTFRPFLGGGR